MPVKSKTTSSKVEENMATKQTADGNITSLVTPPKEESNKKQDVVQKAQVDSQVRTEKA